jgi:hypothetical protein
MLSNYPAIGLLDMYFIEALFLIFLMLFRKILPVGANFHNSTLEDFATYYHWPEQEFSICSHRYTPYDVRGL